jgi:hypothetical protein
MSEERLAHQHRAPYVDYPKVGGGEGKCQRAERSILTPAFVHVTGVLPPGRKTGFEAVRAGAAESTEWSRIAERTRAHTSP